MARSSPSARSRTVSPSLTTLVAHTGAAVLLARELRDAVDPADRARFLLLYRKRIATAMKIAIRIAA